MKALLKVLVLLVVAVVVSGCGTTHPHIAFQHKDIVHKDAPYTFVVEETVIKDFNRGGFGNRLLLGSEDFTAEVSSCIAYAIRNKFSDVNVIVSKDIGKTKKENLPGNIVYIHNITDFSIKTGVTHGFVTRFTADIKTDKGYFSINAVGASGVLVGGSTKESTERACKDFAEKLNDSLKNR